MAGAVSKMVSGWLTRLAASGPEAEAELLHRYVTAGDQQAFAALVERFAPLVWGVCSRALRSPQDAEDAFQATFLALSKQAETLTDRGPLGAWLHLVARRSAALVHRKNQRRREVTVDAMPDPTAAAPADRELAAALDEEVARLPEKYRRPVVLCHLQSQTYAEAARSLGCSVPTVCRRVTQGCELLRGRLAKRGLAPAGGLAVLFAALEKPAAAMPFGLIGRTVQAVGTGAAGASAVVADAVIASMSWAKPLKLAGLLSAVVLAGAGGVAVREIPSVAVAETARPAEPKLDRLGDPLPDGAVARIGTRRFRADKTGAAEDVTFLPDGKTLASVHGGAEVLLWDAATGKPTPLAGPVGARCVAASPDGGRLAAVGSNEVWVWEMAPGEPRPKLRWKRAAPQGKSSTDPAPVTFASEGRVVAVGDAGDRRVRLFDARSGDPLGVIPGRPLALTAAPHGSILASVANRDDLPPGGFGSERVVFWDVATGRAAHTISAQDQGSVVETTFAADGRAFVRLGTGLVRVIDAATGRELESWQGGPGGSRFAPRAGGREVFEIKGGTFRFRDVATGKEVRPALTIPALSAPGSSRPGDVAKQFSPDAKLFATAFGGEVRVWDVATGRPTGPAGQIHGGVSAVAFAPDGRSLLSFAGLAGDAQVWDAATGQPGPVLAAPGADGLAGIAWGADGRPLTFGRPPGLAVGYLLRSDPRTGAAGEKLPLPADYGPVAWGRGRLTQFAVTPSGDRTAVASGPTIDVLDPKGVAVRRLDAGEFVARLILSADGRTVAAVTHKYAPRPPGGGPQPPRTAIQVRDVATGRPRPVPPAGENWDVFLTDPVLSPDGRWLAMATWDKAVVLTETASGRAGQRFEGAGAPRAVAFAPDGRLLAVGGADGIVSVWDLATGRAARRFSGHRGPIAALAFAPDGQRLGSGSADGTALVWDVAGLAGPVPGRPSVAELTDALAGWDVVAAHRAVFALAGQPEAAVPALARHLLPPPAQNVADIERWVAALGDARFTSREQAQTKLERAGDAAAPALRAALAGDPSPEARARLERLLARLEADAAPGRQAAGRAAAALERIGTPAARRVLEDAVRTAGSGPAAEAEAALARLNTGAKAPR